MTMAASSESKPVSDMAADEVSGEHHYLCHQLTELLQQELHTSYRVFDVAELLERVLLHVPNQDLLISVPLVCKSARRGSR
ncbi:hypothetical protein CB0940_11339 [Cercospora beticola]|uniref:Uncharacterized protein n=1 Tax=Cercospora beticola TaxID=122368 RepID=A0A2G5HEQ0_CERBT|nr:hypothetical protein CB0940_11339 [Cercospora beticola]PIA90985.1 hypothetical protein CB0940_11339 [Cercospora beticola]